MLSSGAVIVYDFNTSDAPERAVDLLPPTRIFHAPFSAAMNVQRREENDAARAQVIRRRACIARSGTKPLAAAGRDRPILEVSDVPEQLVMPPPTRTQVDAAGSDDDDVNICITSDGMGVENAFAGHDSCRAQIAATLLARLPVVQSGAVSAAGDV